MENIWFPGKYTIINLRVLLKPSFKIVRDNKFNVMDDGKAHLAIYHH